MSRASPPAVLAAVLVSAALSALLYGCGNDAPEPPPTGEPPAHRGPERGPYEPDRVTVRVLLLAFEGSGVPGVDSTRSRAEARELAFSLAAAIDGGADVDDAFTLGRDGLPPNSNTLPRGVVQRLTNTDVDTLEGETPRANIEKGLGDLAFSLESGAVGVVEWSREESPLGYRVVVRLK